jgi:hypothetical protein
MIKINSAPVSRRTWLDPVGDAATGRAEALLLKDLDPDLKVGLSWEEPGCRRLLSWLLVWFAIRRRLSHRGRGRPVFRWCPCCPMRGLRHQPQMPLRRR